MSAVRVRISPEKSALAKMDAIRDFNRATEHGWHAKGYRGHANPNGKIAGYRAEEAFACFLGIEYVRDPNGFGKSDVAGFSVRCGTKPGYGLVLHNNDGDYPYVLVTAVEGSSLEFDIVGWIPRADALELKERGVGFPQTGPTEPWVIPQRHLQPALTIPRQVSA